MANELIPPSERLRPQEAADIETKLPDNPEKLAELLRRNAQELIQTEITRPAEVRLGAIERLGGDLDHATDLAANFEGQAERLTLNLQETLDQLQTPNTEVPDELTTPSEPTPLTKTADLDIAVRNSTTEPSASTPPLETIPPEPLVEGAAGEDDDLGDVAEQKQADSVKKAEVVEDIFAKRNAASTAYIDLLKQQDISATNHSMDPIVQQARTLLLQQHPEAAARFDSAGNLVLGLPEKDNSGLSRRFLTIPKQGNEKVLKWLNAALRNETLTLLDDRYTIPVIDDPKLQSEFLQDN